MVKKVCLDSARVRAMLWRMDNFADSLIKEGNYYKKAVEELKKELK